MKTLIMVRHGKSSWDYEVGDKDRPLQERGIRDAMLVAKEFKKQDLVPDAAFSSPANRALHTCLIVLRQLGFPLHKLEISNDLYDFSGESVAQFVKKMPDTLHTVMLFGHNYACTHLVNTWGSRYIDNVPTSGLTQLNFETDAWKSIAKGITKQTIFPKGLK